MTPHSLGVILERKATRLTAGGGRVSITTREDVDEELSLLPKELAQLLRRY